MISDTINKEMNAFCRAKGLRTIEIPKFFVVDAVEWTCDNSLLTTSMKVKRGGCLEKFQKLNDAIYKALEDGVAVDGAWVLTNAEALGVQLY